MSSKRDTTKQQRAFLASLGIPHEKGRTFDQAQGWINYHIQAGNLPRNAASPPTEKQLSFLAEHDITIPSDITKEEASALIGVTPLSDRQFEFIKDLGGVPSRSMTRHEASEFIEYLYDNGTVCRKCGANNDRRSDRCPDCGAFLPRQCRLRPPRHIYRPKGLIERILTIIRGTMAA